MVLGLRSGDKIVAREGVFELRKRGQHYVLVRNGYAVMLLNARELVELKRLLDKLVSL